MTSKKSLLSEQLLESRKRANVEKSLPEYNKEENILMSSKVEKYQKENESLKKEMSNMKEENQKYIEEWPNLKAQIANDSFTKDNEIFKYKSLAKKYKTMLEEKGLIKK